MIWMTGNLHGGVTAYHVSSAAFKPAKHGDIALCILLLLVIGSGV